jgi:signal transduction histidine kinase
MATQRNSRRALAWQAAFISLPIVLLTGLGAFYLRQDRLLVRHEAEERARAIAHDTAEKVWRTLTNSGGQLEKFAFRVDDRGALMFPVPYETAPSPRPLDWSNLTADQNALWKQTDSSALGRLLESHLPGDFQAAVRYRRAAVLAAENRLAEADEAFREVYETFPRAISEAGLPIALLAALKTLELPGDPAARQWARPLSWDGLCGLALAEPSALTPVILERAERAGALTASRMSEYRQQWERQELLRELYRVSHHARSATAADLIFWIRTDGAKWLASRLDIPPTNHWIVCRQIQGPRAQSPEETNRARDPLRAMRVTVGPDLKRVPGIGAAQIGPISLVDLLPADSTLPPYLGLGIVAANEPMIPAPNGPLLATATHAENDRDWLKVSVHLVNAQSLYARQQQRVWWFGTLIAISSIAAIIGLMSAWRNFEKQHRLAELKDNFVSSVSHELRAPIASVRLMAESLESGRVQNERKQQEYYHFIVQECQRLSALIQNVLDFSRIDQGRKEYDFESADVLRLVDETVKAMALCAAERQIHLRMAAATSTVHAIIDARAIQQALVNLIDNAIKHSSPGSEVTITVSTQNTVVPAALELSVNDHGEGIPQAEHERIFERFYRIGSELRRQTPGAGIGLSIVRHVVDAHGGRVRVESEPTKGSRFTMQIPLKGSP